MNDNWSHYWGAYWMLQADRVNISHVHVYDLTKCYMR